MTMTESIFFDRVTCLFYGPNLKGAGSAGQSSHLK